MADMSVAPFDSCLNLAPPWRGFLCAARPRRALFRGWSPDLAASSPGPINPHRSTPSYSEACRQHRTSWRSWLEFRRVPFLVAGGARAAAGQRLSASAFSTPELLLPARLSGVSIHRRLALGGLGGFGAGIRRGVRRRRVGCGGLDIDHARGQPKSSARPRRAFHAWSMVDRKRQRPRREW